MLHPFLEVSRSKHVCVCPNACKSLNEGFLKWVYPQIILFWWFSIINHPASETSGNKEIVWGILRPPIGPIGNGSMPRDLAVLLVLSGSKVMRWCAFRHGRNSALRIRLLLVHQFFKPGRSVTENGGSPILETSTWTWSWQPFCHIFPIQKTARSNWSMEFIHIYPIICHLAKQCEGSSGAQYLDFTVNYTGATFKCVPLWRFANQLWIPVYQCNASEPQWDPPRPVACPSRWPNPWYIHVEAQLGWDDKLRDPRAPQGSSFDGTRMDKVSQGIPSSRG